MAMTRVLLFVLVLLGAAATFPAVAIADEEGLTGDKQCRASNESGVRTFNDVGEDRIPGPTEAHATGDDWLCDDWACDDSCWWEGWDAGWCYLNECWCHSDNE